MIEENAEIVKNVNIDDLNTEPRIEVTWEMVREHRDMLLLDAERQYNFDVPTEMLEAWKEYKQKLRDIPETYKDLEDLNQIRWPDMPNFQQELFPARGLR